MKKILELDQSEDDTSLYVILDTNLMFALLQLENPTYYSDNSWLIVLHNKMENETSAEDLLKNTLPPCTSLRLDSRLYFLVIDGKNQGNLFEVYKVGDLIINKLASFKDGNYYAENNLNFFIWDRRNDFRGLELQVMSLPDYPFTTLTDNVSLSRLLLLRKLFNLRKYLFTFKNSDMDRIVCGFTE